MTPSAPRLRALAPLSLLAALSLCLAACDAGSDPDPGSDPGSVPSSDPDPDATPEPGKESDEDSPSVDDLDPAGDEDGDTLSNGVELAGWTVTIQKPGSPAETRQVFSDPFKADTNQDGLDDAQSRMNLLDPAAPGGDTDGDGLSDLDELQIWRSLPNSVDSDGDSEGNPALFDGPEAAGGTSPTMQDTDGDGISDRLEKIEMAQFDPRLADTPLLELEIVGEMQLDVNLKSTTDKETSETLSLEVETSESESKATSDSSTHEVHASIGVKAGVEAEGGFPKGVSVKKSLEVSAEAGYAYTKAKNITKESTKASREAYGEVLAETARNGTEQVDGTLAVQASLRNAGIVSFDLRDVVINAKLRDPKNPDKFKSIASLTAVGDSGTSGGGFASLSLGPNKSAERRFSAILPASTAAELMSDPSRLFFEVGSFELFRQAPELSRDIDFSFLEQETNARTAFLQVDYGNGNSIRRRIATNVRASKGNLDGVALPVALEQVLGIDFKTEARTLNDGSAGTSVLTEVAELTDSGGRLSATGRTIAVNEEANAFWIVVGGVSANATEAPDFEDLRLRAGDSVYVMYVRDSDKDGLYAHEEYLYGTYDSQEAADANGAADPTDSDGDGLSDYEEVKTGWSVGREDLALVAPYDRDARVFSDPTRVDGDDDGKTDIEEREMGTDPLNPDTDGDQYADGPGSGGLAGSEGPDPDPLDPTITGNKPPTLGSLSHDLAGLQATLKVVAGDPDANLKSLFIDWGDSTGLQEVTQGLGGTQPRPQVKHNYPKMGTYQVAAEVVDKFGKRARRTHEITVDLPRGGLIGEWLFDRDDLVGDRVANRAMDAPHANLLSKDKWNGVDWSDIDARANGSFSQGSGYCAQTIDDRFGARDAALEFNTSETPNCGDPTAGAEIRIPGRPSYPENGSYIHAPRLPLDNAFSMAIWVKPSRYSSAGWIVGQLESSGDNPWVRLQLGELMGDEGEDGRVSIVLPGQSSPSLVVTDSVKAPNDAWTLYVATVSRSGDQSTVSLYRNQTLVGTKSGRGDYGNPIPSGSTQGRVFVAGFDEHNWRYEGGLDDLRIFSTVLSQSEVELMYMEKGGPK